MMRSLYAGVSGLKGHQTRMDVVGNNIANVNTTGFKASRVTFADTLSQTQSDASAPGNNIGGTNPKQIGLGSGVASIDMIFTDGSVQSTGKNTDVALSGNGLFVVKSGSETYYTRDGAFEFDADGNYVLPGSGHYVQGWMGSNGVLNTNGATENIVIKAGKSMASDDTNTITYENNLNAAELVVTALSGGTAVNATASSNVTMADPLASLVFTSGGLLDDSTSENYTISKISGGTTSGDTVTASASNPVTVTMTRDSGTYTLTATSGTYTTTDITVGTTTTTYASGGSTTVYASTENPVSVTTSDGTTSVYNTGCYTLNASLSLTTTVNIYDTLGNVHSVPIFFTKTNISSTEGNTWTVSLTADPAATEEKTTIAEDDGTTTTITMKPVSLRFTTLGKYDANNNETKSATMTLTNGANETQNVSLDLSALTQYAGNNTIKGTADGNAAGTLKSISIDSSGIITGVYTNGVRQSEAQIAVAQFTNASGLTKTGSSLYQESNNSGTANVKTAADLGVSITPSALEMSTVDIANEFSDMIITQRGFQSNSKIITTSDEMLETMINMKR